MMEMKSRKSQDSRPFRDIFQHIYFNIPEMTRKSQYYVNERNNHARFCQK